MNEINQLVPLVPRGKVKRAEAMSPMQARLLGDVERALAREKITKTALEERGGPSQQVLDKWAHGSSPTLRTLEKLADALSSELIVAIPGVSDPPASFSEHIGERMSDHDRELAKLIDAMDEGDRRELLGYVRAMAVHRPIEPDVERRPGHARSSASSGPKAT